MKIDSVGRRLSAQGDGSVEERLSTCRVQMVKESCTVAIGPREVRTESRLIRVGQRNYASVDAAL